MKNTSLPFNFHLVLIFFALFCLSACQTTSEPASPSDTPEALGISSRAILNFIEAAEAERKDDLHSFMLLRQGKVAAAGWWAPYDSLSPHMMYSLSKSFTSTAIGIAQAEGLLSIYDPVMSFFPEDAPAEPSRNLQSMRIKDLLRMNTGHQTDSWDQVKQSPGSWTKGFLSLPVEHKPGTRFVYNTGATFMLSAIIQKVTGKTLLEFLKPRLFDPLGFENYSWESNPAGINLGGTGLKIRTRDIARFGQLLLQHGEWEGKQLVPQEWVEEATALQTSNGSNPDSDWDQGYGYQYWRCRPANIYRGDGAFGQYCIVMPDQQSVLAITSGTRDMQAIMNLVWEHLLPAMQAEPLAEDPEAYQALQRKLAQLTLSGVNGQKSSTLAAGLSGTGFQLDQNPAGFEKLDFNFEGENSQIIFHHNQQTYELPVGGDDFARGTLMLPGLGNQPVSSNGAWTSDSTFQVRTYLNESPYYYDFNFSFKGDQLEFRSEINVSFQPDKVITINGRQFSQKPI
jgi:CubicO group peptidase (beta-lactamase class C family)